MMSNLFMKLSANITMVEKNPEDFNEFYLKMFNEDYTRRVLPVSIIFGLTASLGFIANLLVVYVYGMKYKRCNFKYFLFVMGVIGLVQCTMMLPTQVAEMHYWFAFPTSWLCRVSAYVFGYTVIDCYFVLLLIALDRFRKVCRPYNWQIQPNTAKKLCITVSVASLIFATPPGIVSGHHSFVTPYNAVNITVTVCATDDIYKNRDWAIYFLLLFGGIPVSIVILVTCVLYGIILKQFYHGPAFALKSLYNTSTNGISSDHHVADKNGNPLALRTDNANSSPMKAVDSPKAPRRNLSSKAMQLQNVISAIIPGGDSLKSTTSGRLRTSGSQLSKRGVRRKLMRKTLIVLIITITCIVALVITFCLHIIAEEINNNVTSISTTTLNAFVIFHRGSFSIICAIFPIVYGFRDPKFRGAFLTIVGRFHKHTDFTKAPENTREESKCYRVTEEV
ncbi:cholecystokinin receptor type A-like [Mercenaria mercenaria]|uniref:cholecystokinin receptor type A-like n=1 Tax=Mercenaria mercenaria TaxID=6596 RepID=UPI00234F972F|nr:cholecystokinin receptor type A-like [Mercenaria mercenaria]